jgi:hypothetical protein
MGSISYLRYRNKIDILNLLEDMVADMEELLDIATA